METKQWETDYAKILEQQATKALHEYRRSDGISVKTFKQAYRAVDAAGLRNFVGIAQFKQDLYCEIESQDLDSEL